MVATSTPEAAVIKRKKNRGRGVNIEVQTDAGKKSAEKTPKKPPLLL